MIKLIITGDRKWRNKDRIYNILLHICMATYKTVYGSAYEGNLLRFDPNVFIIINGDAEGADKLSSVCALELGIPENHILRYPAPWNDIRDKHPKHIGVRIDGSKYWKGAGPYRNRLMLKEHPDALAVIAFHNNIESSKGTLDMVGECHRQNKKVLLFRETDN